MKYGRVPHLDQPVSRIVFGVIPIGWRPGDEGFELLDAYRAAGGNAIDNSYSYGAAPGEKMRRYYEVHGPDALLRFDKGNHHEESPNGPVRRVTKEATDNDVRGNLERQGVPHSDFYVFHRDDESVPVAEIAEWMNGYVQEGIVKVYGGSNWTHRRVAELNEHCAANGLQGMSVSSPNLSLALANEPMWREALSISDDAEARAWYAAHPEVRLFSWSSGGGGWFARVQNGDMDRVYKNPENEARLLRADEIGRRRGLSTPQVALAWTLNQPGEPFALIGPHNLEQLNECLAAVDVDLSEDELRYLEHGE